MGFPKYKVAVLVLVLLLITVGLSGITVELPDGAVIAFIGVDDCSDLKDGNGYRWNNLRNPEGRFLRGMTSDENPGNTGGKDVHNHGGTTDPGGSGIGVDNDNDKHPSNADHRHNFTTDEQNNVPKYIAVLFCQLKKV